MPRRALRCVVDLSLHAVSAPGVWLPSKEDVYLSVSMFGQYRNTRLLTSVFPLLIHEKFRFEKTYYTALDPAEVADYLDDELVIFELVQLSEYTDGAVRLASFSTNARDFLFPFPSLAPVYSSTDREILLARTVAFPGISPKLEFATKTVIRESLSPEVDALEDALEQERERRTYRKTRRSPVRRARSAKAASSDCSYSSASSDWTWDDRPPHYQQPTKASVSRCRSPSPLRRFTDLDLSDTIDPRPPFVVRKLDQDLIGRVPGGGPDSHAKSRGRKPKKTLTFSKSDTCVSSCLCSLCEESLRIYGTYYPGHTKYYHNLSSCATCLRKYKCTLCEVYQRYYGRPYWGHSKFHYFDDLDLCHSSRKSRYYLDKVIREPLTDPLPVYKPKYSTCDEDAEVAALTSRPLSTYRPRPRSASPILHRPSFEARYGLRPYSPTYYSILADRVRRRIEENRRLARLSELTSPYTPYYSALDRYRLSPYYYPSLYDLELSTRLAKSRRYIPLY